MRVDVSYCQLEIVQTKQGCVDLDGEAIYSRLFHFS